MEEVGFYVSSALAASLVVAASIVSGCASPKSTLFVLRLVLPTTCMVAFSVAAIGLVPYGTSAVRQIDQHLYKTELEIKRANLTHCDQLQKSLISSVRRYEIQDFSEFYIALNLLCPALILLVLFIMFFDNHHDLRSSTLLVLLWLSLWLLLSLDVALEAGAAMGCGHDLSGAIFNRAVMTASPLTTECTPPPSIMAMLAPGRLAEQKEIIQTACGTGWALTMASSLVVMLLGASVLK